MSESGAMREGATVDDGTATLWLGAGRTVDEDGGGNPRRTPRGRAGETEQNKESRPDRERHPGYALAHSVVKLVVAVFTHGAD